MQNMARTLTHQQARRFYDRIGANLDKQSFYEQAATRTLIAHSAFENAHSVFEFGSGTGAFAASLLAHHLPQDASYHAVDSSPTMVALACARLAPFATRVTIRQTDGSFPLPSTERTYDRVVANYVLDLLSPADSAALVVQSYRLLAPDGRLCLVSLAHGRAAFTRLVSWIWQALYTLRPELLGGCRPIALLEYLPATHWHHEYRACVTSFGVTSEIVIASKKPEANGTSALSNTQ